MSVFGLRVLTVEHGLRQHAGADHKMEATPGRRGGGRPPKFDEVRRPVTVTLPERVLRSLASLDADRARAIVKCVDAVVGTGGGEATAVDLVEVLPGKAVIVVGPSRALKQVPWLHLAEIAPARYLLVLPSGVPIERLEVEIQDILENLDPERAEERSMIEKLRVLIGTHRRRKTVTKAELLFVDTGRPSPPLRRESGLTQEDTLT